MIPYGRHSINEEDIYAVTQVLRSEWLTTGPLVEQFENALEKVVGAPCIAVSSGTAALHSAYAAIGIEPGDEIITPPLTFIATQATAAQLGAKIIFADVKPDTGNIDPEEVIASITPRTKAVVAVDYAGHPADLLELRSIADNHNLILIEDAAHSIGSNYNGMPVGSIADITTFSFFPTKNITTGEGGAVASINPDLLRKARLFSRQGLIRNHNEMDLPIDGPWHQEVQDFGLNYRLPDILCALGVSQLSRLNHFKSVRNEIFNRYQIALSSINGLILPTKYSNVDPMWHLYPLRVPISEKRVLYLKLREAGIAVQVNYRPAHLHPVFLKKGFMKGDFPISEEFYQGEISLPMFADTDILCDEYFEKIQSLISAALS